MVVQVQVRVHTCGLASAALSKTYWLPWFPFLRSHDLVRVGRIQLRTEFISESWRNTWLFLCHTICITFVFDTHLLSKHLSIVTPTMSCYFQLHAFERQKLSTFTTPAAVDKPGAELL